MQSFEENLSDATRNSDIDFDEIERSSDSDNDSELQSNESSDSETSTNSEQVFENTLVEFWPESLQSRYAVLISRSFREPLLRRFCNYINNSIAVHKESAISQKALDSDIAAKQKYQTFEKIVQAKSQVQFLEC